MTPNEKAKEMIDMYLKILNSHFINEAKQCALIAVEEIDIYIQQCTQKKDPYANISALEYWQKVKQEIKAL
jgi:hypothetical protein